MYLLYSYTDDGDRRHYKMDRPVTLFGSRNGMIPRLALSTIGPGQSEPLKWHVPMPKALEVAGHPGATIIINLKPNRSDRELNLYELLDVWGWSENGWTPIMMRLRALYSGELAQPDFDPDDFRYDLTDADDPVSSFLYTDGTIRDGELVGRWLPPRPSPTNSALLWPEPMKWFTQTAAEVMASSPG